MGFPVSQFTLYILQRAESFPLIFSFSYLAGLLVINADSIFVLKILYINSYHEGYPSSDDITKGILETIKEKNNTLKVFFMDSKLNPEEEKVQIKLKEALKHIEEFSPDLVS